MELKEYIINFHCDSQNALHIVAEQMVEIKMKHIESIYHFIKHAIFNRRIKLIKINKFNLTNAQFKIISWRI